MRPWDVLGPTVRLYHGSFIGNASSLLEKGIVPRKQLLDCDKLVDDMLADYGVTRTEMPEWLWKYPLERCQDTAALVYLSGDYEYALGNSLAGFEAEDSFRQTIAKHLGLPGYIPPDRDSIVCAVDVPTKLLFSDEVITGGWDREHAFFNSIGAIPRLFRDLDHVIAQLFMIAIFKQPIPARWIKTCWSARRPDFYTPKQRKK